MNLFTPKGFLQIGGVVLLIIGIGGYFIIGPTPEQSIFGSFWWFDNPENIAHTVLGIVALAASMTLPASTQKMLVMAVGALALVVGVYNFISMDLLGAHLESPADLILHLAVGAWGMYASMAKGKATA